METFQTIWKFFRQSGNFSDNPKAFQIIQAFNTFQTIQKIFRQNQNFPDNYEMFKTIWKLSRQFRNFSDFSDKFKKKLTKVCSVQKLSGRAKTFRGAMLLRSLCISVRPHPAFKQTNVCKERGQILTNICYVYNLKSIREP